MRNSLKFNFRSRKKAQFFVLAAFVIVAVLFVLSRHIEPSRVFDTSSAVLIEEPFLFNNIKEKAIDIVKTSENCEELKFNLEEYKTFVENFATQKNTGLNFVFYNLIQGSNKKFDLDSCSDSVLQTSFEIKLTSPAASIFSQFCARKDTNPCS